MIQLAHSQQLENAFLDLLQAVVLTVQHLAGVELLGPEKVKPTFISRKDAVGIANGLAWTSVGGEMLPVEVAVIPNGTGKSRSPAASVMS